jgi:hypothetical protein
MSHTPPASASSSNYYQSIFNKALNDYQKTTRKDLRSDSLLRQLEACQSPDTVLAVFRQRIPGFDKSGNKDDWLTKWLNPTVEVLCSLSETVGGAVALVSLKKPRVTLSLCFLTFIFQAYPPGAVIFTAIGVLLSVCHYSIFSVMAL